MWNNYPYINENDLNLDYILKKLKQLKESVETFIATETVTFADPILWNIASQYAKNTIVLSNSGDAYLSKQTVPANIQLNNTDYWQEIFNFADYVRTANSNLTFNIEQGTTRASSAYAVDDWLLWDDVLYKVTSVIAVDDILTVGGNIEHFTVEDFIKAWINTMQSMFNSFTYDTNLTIQQYKNDIDASELAFTNNLQEQFNQVLAGATVDSEVINARVASNGLEYSTLGESIRANEAGFQNIFDSFITYNLVAQSRITDGKYVNPNTGNLSTNATWSATDYIKVKPSTTYYFYTDSDVVGAAFSSPQSADYISAFSKSGVTPATRRYSIVTDASTQYVRLSVPTANLSTFKFCDSNHEPPVLKDDTQIKISNIIEYLGIARNIDSVIRTDTYSSLLPDADNAIENTFYVLVFSNGDTSIPLNLPFSAFEGTMGTLYTIKPNNSTYKMQLYIEADGKMFMRYYAGGWNTWHYVYSDMLSRYVSRLTSGTYLGTLTDADNAPHNSIYNLNFAWKTTSCPAHLPYTLYTKDPVSILITWGDSYMDKQFFIDEHSVFTRWRVNEGAYSEWLCVSGKKHISVGANGMYQSLLKALKDSGQNTIIELQAGDYDIVQEYEDEYGANYFVDYAGYNTSDPFDRGLWLDLGVEIRAEPGANIIFNYSGNNSDVIGQFSPINLGMDCVLDGVTIDINQNCRYHVHDDFASASPRRAGTNIIENCIFKGYPTQNGCIGGGFGMNAKYIIRNNIFPEGFSGRSLFYHNNASADAQNEIIIYGNYAPTTIALFYYGASTEISKAIVHDNYGLPYVLKGAEPSQNVNIEMVDWNNETP